LRLDTRSDYSKVFDKNKPSRPNRRDLYSYTPRELLNLDDQKTSERSEELKNELKAKQQELKESREHLKDS
jgi:hypothetical protein